MKKLILPLIVFLSVIALSAVAYPPPEKDDMTIAELVAKIFAFDGKVVEIEVSYASNVKQISADECRAYCYFYSPNNTEPDGGQSVTFPAGEDVMEFLEDLSTGDYWNGNTSSFYVYVDGKKLIAIGEKYKKSKGTYSW
jgi:hypothetical protein